MTCSLCSPRIHGDLGPQRRSHSDWRSGHHDSRWDRRRRGGYHTSSESWPVTADEYLVKAKRLKHYGDDVSPSGKSGEWWRCVCDVGLRARVCLVQLSGHLKGEVYLEAALMFMMSCYENEVSTGPASLVQTTTHSNTTHFGAASDRI